MNQEQSVQLALHSILCRYPDMDESLQNCISFHLSLTFVAGYESRKYSNKNKSKPIIQYKDGKEINRFPSCKAAADAVHVNKSTISKAVTRNRKDGQGFRWKYVQNLTE